MLSQEKVQKFARLENKENQIFPTNEDRSGSYIEMNLTYTSNVLALNESLAEQEIQECAQEESEQPEVTNTESAAQLRLKEYHNMLKEYYDPNQQHELKANYQEVDIKDPQFTFEYAGEF